jgi:hypothetical protein
MKRRDFLKFTGSGIAAIAVGSAGGWSLFKPRVAQAAGPIDLTMVNADHEMVDGVPVKAWAYSTQLAPAGGAPLGARVPGPVLFVTEGEAVTLLVANQIVADPADGAGTGGEHGFEIVGVPGTRVESIPNNGAPVTITFTAPSAGTYMYLDPRNAPVNRVMGLHGAMIVLPKPVANQTPYSNPTQAVQNLFDDFGTTPHFPGHPWNRERNVIWMFSTLDPVKHAAAYSHPTGIDPNQFTRAAGYLPQYFTINGKSGFYAAQHGGATHDHTNGPDSQTNISIHGNVGQPLIIRVLNAGLMWQSPHIHGNHVYEIFEYTPGGQRRVLDNLQLIDTWTMPPGAICDQVLPYISPPDIPPDFWQRVAAGTNEELLPLLYPMHDHQEVSNTAAGANYPQGAATHWQIDGYIDPADEVILVDKAELRVRTGELLLEGRISANGLSTEISVHAGPTGSGTPTIGVATVPPAVVGGYRRWSFRGRALQALTTRQVSLHSHTAGLHAELHGVPLTLR